MLRQIRAAQLTIAVTMLAAPASAFALTSATSGSAPSPDNHSSPLALRTNPRHVRFGDVVDVAGTAPASAAGTPVVLEAAPSQASAWRALGQTLVGPRGGFHFRVALRQSGLLRVLPGGGERSLVRLASGPGAGGATLATSPLRPITVNALLRLPAMAHAVLGGQSINVGGRLLPARAGRRVALQGRGGHGWQTLGRTRTGARGGFRFHYALGHAVDRRLRVSFAGDSSNGQVSGPAGTVTVYEPSLASWYDDAGSTACGYHAGLGVANRTLPCGTKVQIRYGGRTITGVVDDRGPYVSGRDWDLNQNAAAALGFTGVGKVWTAG